jgi:site-specific recombinase XerD
MKQYASAALTLRPKRAPGAALVVSNLELVDERARQYAERDLAPRTLHEYGKLWRDFAAWCAAHQLSPLPAAPATLTRYVTERAASGVRPSSLQVLIAAVAREHGNVGAVAPHDHPIFQRVWSGIRREHGVAPRRVAPAVIDELRRMVDTLPADTSRGLRDRAMLVVGFGGAFRRSELVSLDVGDVAFQPRGRGVIITLRHSKVDQEGVGATIGLPAGSHAATCPVRVLRAWLAAAGGRKRGPLVCSVDKYGHIRGRRLHGHDVAALVKRAADAAGLDPAAYSGHSLRAGLATTAAKSGKDDRRIMAQGRWTSRATLDRYVREARLLTDENAAHGIGL